MQLWRDIPDEALQVLTNELAMLRPPMFIYAASPSPPASLEGEGGRRKGRSATASAALDDQDDQACVCVCFGKGDGRGELVCVCMHSTPIFSCTCPLWFIAHTLG